MRQELGIVYFVAGDFRHKISADWFQPTYLGIGAAT